MKLTISERFRIMELLPVEGNIVTLKRIEEARNVLTPTELESKRCNIRADGATLLCDDMDYEAEVEVGQVVNDLVVQKLKELNSQDKLSLRDISFYDKFIND